MRLTSGNTIETLHYFEEHYAKPWNQLEVTCRPEDPHEGCMVACMIEWGHSQSLTSSQEISMSKLNDNLKKMLTKSEQQSRYE